VSLFTHSLLNFFLFLKTLLCSCTKKLHYQIYEKCELDYVQSTHTTCQWSTSVAIMINMYDFMIRDSLVLITLFYYFFARLWASPLKKTRSCPYSVTLLYMWTRCKRLFRQFNKKDYTKFEKLKSVKFISSYSTLVSRLLGMTSKTYIDTHSPFNPFYIHVPHLSHSRVKLKFLTKVKNFTSLILQD